MMYAGIEVTDADSAMAAADVMDEIEDEIEVECPECEGARSVWDMSYELGYINIECPCCGGYGTITVPADGGDDWDDPEPPAPAPAPPALALIVPSYRCRRCQDTGRAIKPSVWFAGRSMEGFCPDCTPHIDVASGRYIRPAA